MTARSITMQPAFWGPNFFRNFSLKNLIKNKVKFFIFREIFKDLIILTGVQFFFKNFESRNFSVSKKTFRIFFLI